MSPDASPYGVDGMVAYVYVCSSLHWSRSCYHVLMLSLISCLASPGKARTGTSTVVDLCTVVLCFRW